MTRAVLDPNVLVSAAITPDGTSAACLRAHAEGRFELVASPRLLDELRNVLSRDRFRPFLAVDDANRLVEALGRDAILVTDEPVADPISRDPGDDYLIALARSSRSHALVTGDRDLLELDLAELTILRPAEFLRILPA
ncbi:MAG: putative toxin-antitoxin system toxin component, PIN family [Gaiellaceae bacterium]